jgi:hypothetical protein
MGLFALGAVLNLVARRALTKASGRAAPCCFRGGSFTLVGSLLVWAWGAAQTLSAIFSQAVDDGTLPRALAPVFSAFSALQFFYVMELLADLDDPFEYSPEKLLPMVTEEEEAEEGGGGGEGGKKKMVTMSGNAQSAEVDLFPIL